MNQRSSERRWLRILSDSSDLQFHALAIPLPRRRFWWRQDSVSFAVSCAGHGEGSNRLLLRVCCRVRSQNLSLLSSTEGILTDVAWNPRHTETYRGLRQQSTSCPPAYRCNSPIGSRGCENTEKLQVWSFVFCIWGHRHQEQLIETFSTIRETNEDTDEALWNRRVGPLTFRTVLL